MIRFLKRISDDIFAGRNIEAYVITILALIIAVLSVIQDVVSLDLQMAALLSAIALLVIKTTEPDSKQVDLDSVLRDRQSFSPFREFIAGGRELLVYAPSAVNVMGNSPDIEREILKHGKMRVLIQDPTITHSVEHLHQQLDETMSHLLISDIERSVSILESMKRRNLNVEYRFMPYSPGFSLVIVDPDGRDGRAVVEMLGFNSESISDRMHVEIHRDQSVYWLEYWEKQFEHMWEIAREPEKQ